MSVFVEIARCGSLTGAARALATSLPTVVRTLAALEEHLRTRLVNRTTRRLALTDEGQTYLEHCRRILGEIDDVDRFMARSDAEPAGLLTLTAPVRFGELHVAPLINQFLFDHPRVDVRVLLVDRTVDLLEEGIDIAVRIGELRDSSLVCRRVGAVRQVVCGSPALIARAGRPERPADLRDLPCLRFFGVAGPVWSFRDGTREMEVRVRPRLSCNLAGASLDACVAGVAFGRFFSYQAAAAIRRGDLDVVLRDYEPPELPVWVMYPPNRLPSPRVRSMVDLLVRRLPKVLTPLERGSLRGPGRGGKDRRRARLGRR
jgi:DNA-binding transcriptional LysR family regulator